MTFNRSLRGQFLFRILILMIVTALISGLIQLFFMKKQIADETNNQATLITKSMSNGIEETVLASKAIEHQIDLRLISQSKHIADLLKDEELSAVTLDELKGIRDQLGLSGITVLADHEDDVVGVASTEPQDIGFSLKKIGFLEAALTLLNGGKASIPGATFIDNNIAILPIARSATHSEKPIFYKYAYYHPPGKKYVISAYVEASEVYQFTNQTGTDAWIAKMKKENSNIVELAVLTPKVFVDPSLEKKIYPPVKRVVHGKYDYRSKEDQAILEKLADQPKKTTSIQEINGKKLYKMFLPISNSEVVYVSLDYDRLSAPLYRHSTILILSGFISLIALFMLTANFFNKIYRNIQRISKQIHLLEKRDFTAKSQISGQGELADLSKSANIMVSTLNEVLQGTIQQATKIQRLSTLVEAESNNMVQEVYQLSMENTTNSREAAEEIDEFLDEVESRLGLIENHEAAKGIHQKIESLRESVRTRTQSTTEITITLSDLLQSLHAQSSELADISNILHRQMAEFKLNSNENQN